jgi:hypothetical protein
MSYDNNPYYYPATHGLVKVAEVDLSQPDYSFDVLVAWADEKGFYLGTDSGCSCPTPFEDYDGRKDMTGPLTADQALEEASSIKSTSYEPNYDIEAWNKFVSTVRAFKFEGVVK